MTKRGNNGVQHAAGSPYELVDGSGGSNHSLAGAFTVPCQPSAFFGPVRRCRGFSRRLWRGVSLARTCQGDCGLRRVAVGLHGNEDRLLIAAPNHIVGVSPVRPGRFVAHTAMRVGACGSSIVFPSRLVQPSSVGRRVNVQAGSVWPQCISCEGSRCVFKPSVFIFSTHPGAGVHWVPEHRCLPLDAVGCRASQARAVAAWSRGAHSARVERTTFTKATRKTKRPALSCRPSVCFGAQERTRTSTELPAST